MIKNPDGSITIPLDERGVDALIAMANRHARDAGVYASEDATHFARKWAALRLGRKAKDKN